MPVSVPQPVAHPRRELTEDWLRTKESFCPSLGEEQNGQQLSPRPWRKPNLPRVLLSPRGPGKCEREVFLQDICRPVIQTRELPSAISPRLGLCGSPSARGTADPGVRRRKIGSRRRAHRLPAELGAGISLHLSRSQVDLSAQPRGPCWWLRVGHRASSSAPPRAGAMETVTRRRRFPLPPMGAHVAGRRGRRSSKMAARPSRAAGSGRSQRSRVKPPPGKGLKELLPPLAAARAIFAAATAVAMRRG